MGSFGAYTLHEQIGAGARGAVHRATIWDDDETLCSVAVKLIPLASFTNAETAALCAADIARATALRHPNIVATRRAGRVGDVAYIEMDHVSGMSVDEILHDVFTDGPPPIPVVASLIAELCDALEFAHQRDILHGDIRPCHLLIDDAGHLRVLGFGMRQLEQPLSQRSYAAPESLDTGTADPRADLFSVGVIAYELVTGRPLFGEQMDPHVRAYVASRAAPPSHCNPACPPLLDEVILRAIAVEPGERWLAARDMRIALGRVGEPDAGIVNAWLDGDDDQASQRTSIALPLPPGDAPMPPPPRRTARGSGRLPPPSDATPVSEPGAGLHEAPTVLRPSTDSGQHELELAIEPQPEPYVVLDDEGFEDDDLPVVEVTPELELGEWPEPAAGDIQQTPAPAARSWPARIAEWSVAFAAGAGAMYLLRHLIG